MGTCHYTQTERPLPPPRQLAPPPTCQTWTQIYHHGNRAATKKTGTFNTGVQWVSDMVRANSAIPDGLVETPNYTEHQHS